MINQKYYEQKIDYCAKAADRARDIEVHFMWEQKAKELAEAAEKLTKKQLQEEHKGTKK